MCTTRSFFRPVPVKYDLRDYDLIHEFRKCMFARQLKSGVYHFRNVDNGDYVKYRIANRNYAGSYGVLNGTKINISVDGDREKNNGLEEN
jgi:hypothetical protein